MTPQVLSFLDSVLGQDGAQALVKAAERAPGLANTLPPRAILSWLLFASRWGYEGEIPGVPGSFLKFSKSAPDLFDGLVEVYRPDGTDVYEFSNASILHVAAATAVALQADAAQTSPKVRDTDIAKLGKNLDILIATRFLNLIKKAQEESTAQSSSSVEESSEMDKQEAPGVAAGPKAPKAPTMAVAPAKQPRMKTPSLKITKAQAAKPCSVCDERQFQKSEFVGCFCVRDLGQFAKSQKDADGNYTVAFGPEWSENDLSVFIDMIQSVGDGE